MPNSARSFLGGIAVFGLVGAPVLWVLSFAVARTDDGTGPAFLASLAGLALIAGVIALLLWIAVQAVAEDHDRSVSALVAQQQELAGQMAELTRRLTEQRDPGSDTVEPHREVTNDVDPGRLRP